MLDDLDPDAATVAATPVPATPVPAASAPSTSSLGPLRSVVVVGAGLAGARAVAALRDQGYSGRLTVLGAEGVQPYDRPPLSKQLLTRTEPAWLREELGLDLGLADDVRLGEAAVGLALGDAATVTTTHGEVAADAVVLASGSRPVRPPGWESAVTLHTAEDAARLRAAVVPGARLVVVGAGWIGAEVAGVAAGAGVDVTVVEAASSPLAAALTPAVGALTAPWYAAAGVRLLTGSVVVDVRPDAVTLADGEVLPADVVLAAVGARPESGWLTPTLTPGLGGELLVDEAYRVLGADELPLAGGRVLAVGDLARRRSARHGWVPGGHWDGALRGPEIAVRALLAGPPTDGPAHPDVPAALDAAPHEDPAPYVFSTQLGHELALYGVVGPTDEAVLRGDPAQGFTVLWFAAGEERLTAVLTVDRPRDVAAARRLFTGAALPRLSRALAADPDLPLRSAVL